MEKSEVIINRDGSQMSIQMRVSNEREGFDMMLEAIYKISNMLKDHSCDDKECQVREISEKIYNLLDNYKQ